MMTDSELLKFAAKAAGAKMSDYSDRTPDHWIIKHSDGAWRKWQPLTDDGDALRLAVKLKIDIEWQATNQFPESRVEAYQRNDEGTYFCADEHEDDYRRAIVRAAAEIGKAMP